ncbi:MAG: DoxX [Anaerolineae bacterium]|jgi:thiosulfate dehydrogenase [quinone] large subunit|nr:MAG: DoxX [Anaerolineae bacterium]
MNNRILEITDPPFVQQIFGNPRWAWLWLVMRLYVGYTWLTSGWGKLNNPAWMAGGEALKGFWERAIQIPEPPARPLIAFDWYRTFIQTLLEGGHYVWFSKLIVFGEILVGLGLLFGAFVGITAFFGAFMNWNFMMAGTASINPVLFTFSIFLILAWKTAGWWGLDRWLLPLLGTPWRPGRIFEKESMKTVESVAQD